VKKLLKFFAFLLTLLVVLIAIVGLIGTMLPRNHVSSRTALYRQPIEAVWDAIADIEHSPSWRVDVKAVERLPDRNGHPVWNQVTPDGNWPLEITESVPPTRLVAVVADSSQGFGGTWTYSPASEGAGTRLTITEAGWVANPFFRFMAKFVFGLHSTQDAYLAALGRKFGENVVPGAAP
jgi:uncharacterized protein YndB with AHSA1/START domain